MFSTQSASTDVGHRSNRDCTIHRSPGHQIDGGSLAEIFLTHSANEIAALIGIAAQLRAILAAHAALQFVDWRHLRLPNDVECDRLMCIAAEAADAEIAVARVQRVEIRTS